MHKFLFIAVLIFFSCAEKKQQDAVVYTEKEEQAPATEKKYVYVDTPQAETPLPYDTEGAAVVEAPAEEKNPEEQAQNTIEVDTAVYRWELAVSPDSVNEWKKMKSFAYVKHMDSLLKAARQKQKEPVKEAEDDSPRVGRSWLDGLLGSSGLQVFLWILAGGFVLFIIYQLFVTNGAFKRSPKKQAADTAAAKEEIITPESDFDRMIREAVLQRNYRLAIRYHYLQTLHLLAAGNYVQLAADKTNYSYVREIADYNRQNAFAGLTLNYEYVWYGEFDIDEVIYGKLKTEFQAFNTKI